MSSYHSSFSYKGINSANRGLIVAAFNADNGNSDTFLSMDSIFTESYDGTQRHDYGAKYNSVATINITVINEDATDMSVARNRELLRWLTGARTNSWLDLYEGNDLKYSFFCRVIDVKQRKLDSRVIGLKITFESIHPWAWSAPKTFECSLGEEAIRIDDNGYIYKGENGSEVIEYGIDANGVIYNDSSYDTVRFSITNNGVIYSDSEVTLEGDMIYNDTDDLYTYTYLNMDYQSNGSTSMAIYNEVLDELTEIKNIKQNEKITISANQFIVSDNEYRIFGDDFNFVWPRLCPGENKLILDATGRGHVSFTYRHPIKIGDCAIDIDGLVDHLCNTCTVEEEQLMEMLEAVLI